MKQCIACHAGEGVPRTFLLPGVSVICSPTTTEPLGDVTEPTVAVVARGAKETALNGRTFIYSAGQFVITSLELPVAGHIVLASPDEPFLAVVLKLRAEKIAALLLETAPAATGPWTAADAMPKGIAVSEASPALLDAIGRLLALVDTPRDAAALADGVEREVLWRLITGPQGGTVRQIGEDTPETCHNRGDVLDRLAHQLADGLETQVIEIVPCRGAVLLGLRVKCRVPGGFAREHIVYQVMSVSNQRVVDIRGYPSRPEAAAPRG